MHTVGWLELGDEQRARENFRMMFRNINPPFKVCPLYTFYLDVICNDMACFTILRVTGAVFNANLIAYEH